MMITDPENCATSLNERGFTLIEMLIVMAIVGMMMSAVYAVQRMNVRAVDVEEERVEIQQDQRISLDFITRQLRMAGYDKAESNLPGIVEARSNYIYFTSDLNDDGDLNDGPGAVAPEIEDVDEHVAFCVFDSTEGRALSYITGSTSGVATTSAANPVPLAHAHGNNHQAFAPIQDLEFFYTLEDGTTTLSPTAMQLADIRSVEVTILSRADTPDPRWTDNQVYRPASFATEGTEWGPYNDNTRRRMMTANVRFRNLGL
jgi:type IV pilus assembly protein PilW